MNPSLAQFMVDGRMAQVNLTTRIEGSHRIDDILQVKIFTK